MNLTLVQIYLCDIKNNFPGDDLIDKFSKRNLTFIHGIIRAHAHHSSLLSLFENTFRLSSWFARLNCSTQQRAALKGIDSRDTEAFLDPCDLFGADTRKETCRF